MSLVRSTTLLALVVVAGCQTRRLAYEGGVLLAEADAVQPAQTGPRLVVRTTDDPIAATPSGDVLRVAIERGVPWQRVRSLMQSLDQDQRRYQMIVGRGREVFAFVPSDSLGDEPVIQLLAYADGQFCVRPPESTEAYCVQGAGGHIPRAFVRETLRKAVKEYDRTSVSVVLDPTMEWADVVRAIDGARTCCGSTKIRVAIRNQEPKPITN